jgi:two-component system LytT family sensor kinase
MRHPRLLAALPVWLLILLILLISAVFSLDVLRASPGPHVALALALAFTSACMRFGLWGLAALLLWRLMARVPLVLRPCALAVHLGATSGLALAVSAAAFALQLLVRPGWLAAVPQGGQLLAGSWAAAALLPEVGTAFVMSLPWDVLISWAALAAVALSHQALRARARAQLALALGAEVDRAHLQALEAQLQPHFLFNALNTVSALLESNPGAARKVLRSLRRLFGRLLATRPGALTRVRDEVALIGHYVAIERARFGQRLQVHLEIDPATAPALIPALLLQPLIENAVRHGASARSGPFRVRLRIHQQGELLHLEVHDDGPGACSATRGTGIGLSNTRARLQARYPTHAFSFTPSAPPWGGAKVSITLPLQSTPPAAKVTAPANAEAETSGAGPHLCAPWRSGWALFTVAMIILNLLWSSARHYAAPTFPAASFWSTFAIGTRGAFAFILLFPLVAATSRLLMGARMHRAVLILAHLLLALGLSGLKACLVALLQHLGGPRVEAGIAALIAARIYSDVLHYAVMAGICHALAHHARARAASQRAARLEAELTAARLGALRLRLDPTWLQGSLAAIEPLVGRAPEHAERRVAALGDRLRQLLAPGAGALPLGGLT